MRAFSMGLTKKVVKFQQDQRIIHFLMKFNDNFRQVLKFLSWSNYLQSFFKNVIMKPSNSLLLFLTQWPLLLIEKVLLKKVQKRLKNDPLWLVINVHLNIFAIKYKINVYSIGCYFKIHEYPSFTETNFENQLLLLFKPTLMTLHPILSILDLILCNSTLLISITNLVILLT